MKVSVIVPVYNNEKFLSRCIESIQNQTLKEIEIIIVNDGSNDSTPIICSKFQDKDKRIRIIDKPNEGVSKARNIGIKEASSEYLTFVDSDDWIESTMCEKMYKEASKNNADICCCDLNRVNGKLKRTIYNNASKKVYYKNEIINQLLYNMIAPIENESNTILRNACTKMYKTEFIKNNKLEFESTIDIGEDMLFNIDAFLVANRICFYNKAFYNYFNNSNSTSQKYKDNQIHVNMILYKNIKDRLEKHNILEDARRSLDKELFNALKSVLINECAPDNPKKLSEKLLLMNDICKRIKKEKLIYVEDKEKIYKKIEKKLILNQNIISLYMYYKVLRRVY